MNKADRKLIEDMEAGQIYHEMQPGEPPHERQYCFVCQDYRRYRELINEPDGCCGPDDGGCDELDPYCGDCYLCEARADDDYWWEVNRADVLQI